jgi:hypothetical protein
MLDNLEDGMTPEAIAKGLANRAAHSHEALPREHYVA